MLNISKSGHEVGVFVTAIFQKVSLIGVEYRTMIGWNRVLVQNIWSKFLWSLVDHHVVHGGWWRCWMASKHRKQESIDRNKVYLDLINKWKKLFVYQSKTWRVTVKKSDNNTIAGLIGTLLFAVQIPWKRKFKVRVSPLIFICSMDTCIFFRFIHNLFISIRFFTKFYFDLSELIERSIARKLLLPTKVLLIPRSLLVLVVVNGPVSLFLKSS